MTSINQPPSDDAAVAALAAGLLRRRWRLVTAESCTGGLVAARLTDVAGSSDWFEGAFVTYRLSAKTRMVGVPSETLSRWGAVSEPTARAMAEGALENSDAHLSVAITGVAGPGGGEPHTPVGTVWFAWAVRQDRIACAQTAEHQFDGDRPAIRAAAVRVAIEGAAALLDNLP